MPDPIDRRATLPVGTGTDVDGQQRCRPLSATLALARVAATTVGVTRLGDLTGVDRIGVPVFQAVRPASLALSVAQGKGLTRQAAMVSALLESVEMAVAEVLPCPAPLVPLTAMNADCQRLWALAPRHHRGIGLWPQLPRGWCAGRDIGSGRPAMMPFDLVSMDFTITSRPDVPPSSVGLASGNDADEALAGALAEAIEHDMTASWRDLSPRERRRTGIDPDSVDAPLARPLLRRLAAAGFGVMLWDTGQDHGVPGFQCAITDPADPATTLPPAIGNGCHVDREIALLRAVLEAIQARATLIAGARDDLQTRDFGDGQQRIVELVLGTLAFGHAARQWQDVAGSVSRGSTADIDLLLAAAARRSPLPVLAMALASPVPGLAIAKVLAPGLQDEDRLVMPPPAVLPTPPRAPALLRLRRRPDPQRPPIIFVGPSLTAPVAGDIDVAPPAVAGDLATLLPAPPPVIGLIDGCFEIAPSVWHKEIMDLVALGVHVLGGASLGAIRAAELQRFGMVGIGQVFAAYRDGHISRDDAVMVSHAPAALRHRALTVALVDAEAALLSVPMPIADRRVLQRIVRTISFRRRDWPTCLAEFARRTGRPAPVRAETLAAMPSLKAADAALLVAAVRALAAGPPLPERPRPPLTCFYSGLIMARATTPP